MYIGDISPPLGVKKAMEMQAEAERKKRAQILESEGNGSMDTTTVGNCCSV
jgi:regulator of protease activity HflC (stomatin/prohibitin superfamily)